MRLINKEDLGYVGKVGFAGKSLDYVVRLPSRFFQCFKYAYVVYFLGIFSLFSLLVFMSYWRETYSEPCQTYMMEFLVKIVNDLKSWTIFTKDSS